MIKETYQDVLAFLYDQLPMFQRQGKSAFKKDLTNTKDLCWELGLPHWKFKSIHVAGTNGKGSVSSMLASILAEAGYKTGLYTSPHLKAFTERIRINGKEMPEKEVMDFVRLYRHAINQIQPSFFELTVGMAFSHFAEEEVDIAVVETGLGGRLDSTNIITPELSVITQIDFDHMDLLGDTLEAIAGEKAGIIKRFTPVVIGEKRGETESVFRQKAEQMEAPIFFAPDQYQPISTERGLGGQTFEVGEQSGIRLDLAGHYQAQNLATVLSAIEVLQEDGWDISEEAIRNGLARVKANTGLRGRMELLEEHPLMLCDTAHNPSGVRAVLDQLAQLPHKRLHMVWGMVSDKQHADILQLLPKDATYYFVKPDIPRGLNAESLQEKATEFGLKGVAAGAVGEGMALALKAADPDDLIFVGGSTFVVAEAI